MLALAQFVPLAESALSGALVHIPSDIYDLDPDWEIDPDSLELMGKLGAPSTCQRFYGRPLSYVLVYGRWLTVEKANSKNLISQECAQRSELAVLHAVAERCICRGQPCRCTDEACAAPSPSCFSGKRACTWHGMRAIAGSPGSVQC